MLYWINQILGAFFICALALWPVCAQTPPIQSDLPKHVAFSRGTYQETLAQFDCPKDQAVYGDYYEGDYEPAVDYCGLEVPAGYWVYRAPQWTIYAQLKQYPPLQRARLGGKYTGLLNIVSCPQESGEEQATYGAFYDYGWEASSEYCGQTLPAAYWVWVAPHWYLWRYKDIASIGFDQLEKTVILQQPLTLQMEYAQGHEVWAAETLANFQRGIVALEKWSEIDFPGLRPYLLEERPNFDLLGMAGRHKMALASPPRGTPWTLLHEMVHIWNVEVEPLWFNEGQANFISYLLVKELGLPFYEPETLSEYLTAWEAIKDTEADLPLQGNYERLPQGKAMAFWIMLYELGGPDLIRNCFQMGMQDNDVSLDDLRQVLRRHLNMDPNRLLSGWVLPGSYLIHKATDLGPVRYSLP